MFLKGGILIISFCLLAGCWTWAPRMESTGTKAIYYYHNGKAEEVYRVPMENAYVSAIRTMNDLGLEIILVKKSEHHCIVKAENSSSKCQVILDLEGMRDSKYIKASFRGLNHTALPDRLYSRWVMKEFNNNLEEVQNMPLESKRIRTLGGE